MSERVLQAIINIDNRTVTIALSDMLGRSHVRPKREYGVPEAGKLLQNRAETEES